MNTKYYLAYGSNLNRYQMRVRCPGAKPLGTAVIENYRLLFKGSQSGAYLTIEPAEGYRVPVAVWAVTEEDEQMLDRYEGYPAFYYKSGLTITYKGILSNLPRTCTAFVYIMHEERKLGIPSTRYFTTCAQGYRDFGFDTALLMEAYNHSFYTEAEYED